MAVAEPSLRRWNAWKGRSLGAVHPSRSRTAHSRFGLAHEVQGDIGVIPVKGKEGGADQMPLAKSQRRPSGAVVGRAPATTGTRMRIQWFERSHRGSRR